MAFSLAVSATAQTGSTISAGTAAGSLKSAYRTFSLTGTKGTTFLLGDQVQLWGSNDGGATYQPLVGPSGGGIFLTFGTPEIVINDSCTHYATQRTSVAVGSTLAAVGGNGEPAANPQIQAGTTTLASGTKTVSGVTLTTSSVILLSMRDPGAGEITGFGSLDAPVASRNVSAGTFVINAIDDSKNVITTQVSTVDYLIVG